MTRGKIAIITNDGRLIVSTEFNGDMSPIGEDAYGREVFDELSNTSTEDGYEVLVWQINQNYEYDGDLFYEEDLEILDMSRDYFDDWFSDYVYIKNLSDNDVVFTDKNGQKVRLSFECTAIFNFGEFYAADEFDLDKRTLIEDLYSLKEAVPDMPHDKVYDELWRLCADWDELERSSDLTDRIQEWDFVTPDFVEDLMKENTSSVSRMRHFIGDTYEADIYMLDGYGNVRNCEDDDFTGLIDELTEQLEKEIEPPQLAKAMKKEQEMGG